jgi:hypothetical protein
MAGGMQGAAAGLVDAVSRALLGECDRWAPAGQQQQQQHRQQLLQGARLPDLSLQPGLGQGPGGATSASAPVSPAQPPRHSLASLHPLTPQVPARGGGPALSSSCLGGQVSAAPGTGLVMAGLLGPPPAAAALGAALCSSSSGGGQGGLLASSADWSYLLAKPPQPSVQGALAAAPAKAGGSDGWGSLPAAATGGSTTSSGSWQLSDVASIFSSSTGSSMGAGASIWSYNPASSFQAAAPAPAPAPPTAAGLHAAAAGGAAAGGAAGDAASQAAAVARVLFPHSAAAGPRPHAPHAPGGRAPRPQQQQAQPQQQQAQGAPAEFLCPLTRALMRDPVVAADGFTYERAAIAAWLAQHGASPLTRRPLPSRELLPNLTMRAAIQLLG